MRERLLAAEKVKSIEWHGDRLSLLDQRAADRRGLAQLRFCRCGR